MSTLWSHKQSGHICGIGRWDVAQAACRQVAYALTYAASASTPKELALFQVGAPQCTAASWQYRSRLIVGCSRVNRASKSQDANRFDFMQGSLLAIAANLYVHFFDAGWPQQPGRFRASRSHSRPASPPRARGRAGDGRQCRRRRPGAVRRGLGRKWQGSARGASWWIPHFVDSVLLGRTSARLCGPARCAGCMPGVAPCAHLVQRGMPPP